MLARARKWGDLAAMSIMAVALIRKIFPNPGQVGCGLFEAADLVGGHQGLGSLEEAFGKGLEVFDGNGKTLGAVGAGDVHADAAAFKI